MQVIIESLLYFHPELQGNALANVFGQVGMFLSPYIVYSATLHETLPFAILAVASFAGAGISALLPETAGVALPDTVEEAEQGGMQFHGF